MWHALRAELAYFRPWLLGGLGIAVGVTALVSVIWFLAGGPPSHVAAGLRGLFLILAPMVVGFIVQGIRAEERRSRLLLSGPLTPRDLALLMVLLPTILFAVSVLPVGLVIGAGALATGRLELESLKLVGFVGGQLFAYVQMALLPQEAVAAAGQGRRRAAVAGWAGFVVAILLLSVPYIALSQKALTWMHMIPAHLAVAVAVMAMTVALYTGRTDFTR